MQSDLGIHCLHGTECSFFVPMLILKIEYMFCAKSCAEESEEIKVKFSAQHSCFMQKHNSPVERKDHLQHTTTTKQLTSSAHPLVAVRDQHKVII